ncbi:hypothetical protein [Vibrio diazotrophicus]|uniref:hypothetical protein n=1 Tax=Vibrio diazotrophicus TaxID=685 RepID=UPI00142E7F40|nr:hypothetical protein [Vibrio diazotrophicus]NIY91151.1 hypothetical protein [Vibrio diazotrophicus]
MTLNDIASVATIGAFLVAICSLAFSAKRYISITEKTQKSERFEIYHELIKTISKGIDADGVLKLASQIAYIYELRNFPEYKNLTENILNQLRQQWSTGESDKVFTRLKDAIDDTLSDLQRQK